MEKTIHANKHHIQVCQSTSTHLHIYIIQHSNNPDVYAGAAQADYKGL